MGNPAGPSRKARALSGLIALAVTSFALVETASAQCADPLRMGVEQGEAQFRQTRRIKGVANPLVSTGTMAIRGDVLTWRVREPIDIVTTITPTGVTQSIDGAAPQRMAGGGAFEQSGLLRLVTGDLSQVERNYVVVRAPAANGAWRLTMTPKDAQLARFLTNVEVRGCTRVDGVLVRQADGDSIEIERRP